MKSKDDLTGSVVEGAVQDRRPGHIKIERKGLTLIPLKLYLKHGLVKVELGLCEGKHTYDKSAALKEKAVKKDASRDLL